MMDDGVVECELAKNREETQIVDADDYFLLLKNTAINR